MTLPRRPARRPRPVGRGWSARVDEAKWALARVPSRAAAQAIGLAPRQFHRAPSVPPLPSDGCSVPDLCHGWSVHVKFHLLARRPAFPLRALDVSRNEPQGLFTRIQEWLQPFALRASKPRRLRKRTCSTAFKLGRAAVDLTTPGGCRGERNCDMPPGLDAIIRTRPLGFWHQAKFGSLERHLSPRSRV